MNMWTAEMKDELAIATEHYELLYADEVEEYMAERAVECKRRIAQASADIEECAQSLVPEARK